MDVTLELVGSFSTVATDLQACPSLHGVLYYDSSSLGTDAAQMTDPELRTCGLLETTTTSVWTLSSFTWGAFVYSCVLGLIIAAGLCAAVVKAAWRTLNSRRMLLQGNLQELHKIGCVMLADGNLIVQAEMSRASQAGQLLEYKLPLTAYNNAIVVTPPAARGGGGASATSAAASAAQPKPPFHRRSSRAVAPAPAAGAAAHEAGTSGSNSSTGADEGARVPPVTAYEGDDLTDRTASGSVDAPPRPAVRVTSAAGGDNDDGEEDASSAPVSPAAAAQQRPEGALFASSPGSVPVAEADVAQPLLFAHQVAAAAAGTDDGMVGGSSDGSTSLLSPLSDNVVRIFAKTRFRSSPHVALDDFGAPSYQAANVMRAILGLPFTGKKETPSLDPPLIRGGDGVLLQHRADRNDLARRRFASARVCAVLDLAHKQQEMVGDVRSKLRERLSSSVEESVPDNATAALEGINVGEVTIRGGGSSSARAAVAMTAGGLLPALTIDRASKQRFLQSDAAHVVTDGAVLSIMSSVLSPMLLFEQAGTMAYDAVSRDLLAALTGKSAQDFQDEKLRAQQICNAAITTLDEIGQSPAAGKPCERAQAVETVVEEVMLSLEASKMSKLLVIESIGSITSTCDAAVRLF